MKHKIPVDYQNWKCKYVLKPQETSLAINYQPASGGFPTGGRLPEKLLTIRKILG
jgi:hypothetical protein